MNLIYKKLEVYLVYPINATPVIIFGRIILNLVRKFHNLEYF